MTDIAKIMRWVIGNDTGISSKCIAAFMCGADVQNRYCDAPSDPSDLGRCLRLLELFPEWKPRMLEMSTVNDRWAKIVPHWEELGKIMADEVGIDWSKGRNAKKTYDRMQAIMSGR